MMAGGLGFEVMLTFWVKICMDVGQKISQVDVVSFW